MDGETTVEFQSRDLPVYGERERNEAFVPLDFKEHPSLFWP
jgi:hypothetical protein